MIGAGGLLGEAFVRLLSDYSDSLVRGVGRRDVDLREIGETRGFLESEKFDVLINCSGMTGLEQCLDDVEGARLVNVEAPRVMAEVCAESSAKMVHFSTDYVFGGEVEKELVEDDEVGPVNVYGETKLEGERAVLAVNRGALVGRVSWIFGFGRRSFVDQVLDCAGKEDLRYISDKWSVPNFADDLVGMAMGCLEQGLDGVVHLVSEGGGVSWYEYACEVIERAKGIGLLDEGLGLPGESQMAEVGAFRAMRPVHTVLESVRLRELGVERVDWRGGLDRFLAAKMGGRDA